MTITPDCNLDGAFLLDGVCAFLCGLSGRPECLVLRACCDGFFPVFRVFCLAFRFPFFYCFRFSFLVFIFFNPEIFNFEHF